MKRLKGTRAVSLGTSAIVTNASCHKPVHHSPSNCFAVQQGIVKSHLMLPILLKISSPPYSSSIYSFY